MVKLKGGASAAILTTKSSNPFICYPISGRKFMSNYNFGDRVRRINSGEVFLVLGYEPNGFVQMARYNHKTAENPKYLVGA